MVSELDKLAVKVSKLVTAPASVIVPVPVVVVVSFTLSAITNAIMLSLSVHCSHR